jgi:hypothetical protein
MEDVLDLYARPYDPQVPVVCLDEAGKELRSTPRGTIPMKSGQPAREDFEWKRCGLATLFMAVEPLAGRRQVRLSDRRTAWDFAEVLRALVEEDYPHAQRIALVVDNLNTHTPACLYERFEPERARRIAQKIEWHYTPPHGSWLNIAECELSVLARQCLNRRIADEPTLRSEVEAWVQELNQANVKVDWHFTTADARVKLKRLYPVLSPISQK